MFVITSFLISDPDYEIKRKRQAHIRVNVQGRHTHAGKCL